MATELHALPTSIVAGETLAATLTGVLTTGRSCSYQFASKTPLTVACTIVNGVFILTVSAAQTLILKSGIIRFAAFATTTATSVVECVDSGYLTVEASPLATSDYSAALTAVDAAIANYAANPNKRVALGAMSVEYRSLDELLALRAFYIGEIQRDISGAGTGPTRILARFAW